MTSTRKYGLLLPHFGSHSTAQLILDAARQAEALGFDSLWVRDHLTYIPHGYEDPDPTFFEPLVTMSMVGAATERMILGSGAMIPTRHPLYLAQQLASLSQFLGPDRLILGFGIGGFIQEFEAIGLGEVDRPALLREQVDVMRQIWSGRRVTHEGRFYSFKDAEIHPSPAGSIPIWYCGNSSAAARRAAEFADGWLPGRLTLRSLEKRVARMRRLASEAGRPTPTLGLIPVVVPARTREAALRGFTQLDAVLANFNASRVEERPPSGRFETIDNLAGAIIAGPPEHVVEQIKQLEDTGCSHTVFDMRFSFDRWDECVRMMAEEVLPELRK